MDLSQKKKRIVLCMAMFTAGLMTYITLSMSGDGLRPAGRPW